MKIIAQSRNYQLETSGKLWCSHGDNVNFYYRIIIEKGASVKKVYIVPAFESLKKSLQSSIVYKDVESVFKNLKFLVLEDSSESFNSEEYLEGFNIDKVFTDFNKQIGTQSTSSPTVATKGKKGSKAKRSESVIEVPVYQNLLEDWIKTWVESDPE